MASLFVEHQHGDGGEEGKIFSDLELEQAVDPVMRSDDLNKDGYIDDYPEFVISQQKVTVNTV